jgi:lipoprotein signal peptidase
VIPGVIDWPIFNRADSWLVIGAGMLLVASLRPAADGFTTPAGESPHS